MYYASGAVDIIMVDWDRGHYMDASQRFLDIGTPYLPWEVAGPFDYTPLTFLHPPLALWLMVPFLFVPAILWYVVPIAIVVVLIASWRPSPLALALVALCLMWPRTPAMIVTGNTDMWVTAFVALGLQLGWPGPFVLIKPSLAPLALAGFPRRAWWLGVGAVVVLAVPFGLLWVDWMLVAAPRAGRPAVLGAGHLRHGLPVLRVVGSTPPGAGVGGGLRRPGCARRHEELQRVQSVHDVVPRRSDANQATTGRTKNGRLPSEYHHDALELSDAVGYWSQSGSKGRLMTARTGGPRSTMTGRGCRGRRRTRATA